MKTYEEAVKLWAARRLGIDVDDISYIEEEEVPFEEGHRYSEYTADSDTPAHSAMRVYLGEKVDYGCKTISLLGEPMMQIVYEMLQIGMED